jgi:hypothetical protein
MQDGIQFHWAVVGVGTKSYIWEHTSASPFESSVLVSPVLTANSFFLPKADQVTRYSWVTAQSSISTAQSNPAPSGDGIPGAALTLTPGFSAKISQSAILKVVFESSGTTKIVTVSPVNGVAPFTYLWERTSGDTTINPTSNMAASTAFSNTGMTIGETNTAVFRCTITDSTAATAEITASVTFVRES